MSYDVVVSSLATEEILEAYDWYESVKKELGDGFLPDREKIFESISKNPKACSYYQNPQGMYCFKNFLTW